MAYSAGEFRASGGDPLDDLHEAAFLRRGCCYLNFRSRRSEAWERIPPSSPGEDVVTGRSWWEVGAGALRSVRGWPVLVAGPRRKTNFVRRFNRTTSCRARATARFQYDPQSYLLNFDHGEPVPRDFSSRYSAIPAHDGGIHGGAIFYAGNFENSNFCINERNKNSNKSK